MLTIVYTEFILYLTIAQSHHWHAKLGLSVQRRQSSHIVSQFYMHFIGKLQHTLIIQQRKGKTAVVQHVAARCRALSCVAAPDS